MLRIDLFTNIIVDGNSNYIREGILAHVTFKNVLGLIPKIEIVLR